MSFAYRRDDVAAEAASGAVRFDISCHPDTARWYLDASWKTPVTASPTPGLAQLRQGPVVAVDLNTGHLAVVVDALGNAVGSPATIPLELAGLPASTRHGRLRAAISELIALAETNDAKAIVVEDLDFAAARCEGREHCGRRPARGCAGPSGAWWPPSPRPASGTAWCR